MNQHRKVICLIPTYDNIGMLHHALNSIVEYTASDPKDRFYHIVLVNNGTPEIITRSFGADDSYTVVESGENLGWEGGLVKGLEWMNANSPAPYVLFANDDIQIPPNDPDWLAKMVKTLDENPSIAAVGPTSNFVMGPANFASALPMRLHEVSYLVGFCVLVRVSALEAVGGVALGLPGGDDIDLSLRLRTKGWKLALQGDVYVHHWGSATGSRLHGKYWNSPEMTTHTRNEMIRRHGLKVYLEMYRFGSKEFKS